MRERTGAWVAPDGWASTKTEDGVEVHVRVRQGPDGRLVVTGVLVEADEVTTDTLRQVQPTRVLAGVGTQPSSRFANVRVTADGLLEAYSHADDSDTTLGALRARATHKLLAAKREVVGRPDGAAPDDFYRRFAATYRSAATESSKPAVILAGENSVPVETVRRWIKEARRRGHLEPGRKGRAG